MPEMVDVSPFDKLKLADKQRFQPQCRMPDYAASGIACVVITAFSVILFGIIRLSASTESCPVCSSRLNATRLHGAFMSSPDL